MNKKLVLGIAGGCALLAICGCISSIVLYPSFKKGFDEGLKKAQEGTSTTTLPTATTTESAQFTTYNNSTHRFQIQYPHNWEKDENIQGAVVMFKSPKESTDDTLQDNVNILTEDLQGENYTLQEYSDLSINNIKAYILNANIINESNITLNGQNAHLVIYTGTSNGLNLKWRQAWTIKNGTAYIITFTAQEKDYSKFERTAQDIMSSFKAN